MSKYNIRHCRSYPAKFILLVFMFCAMQGNAEKEYYLNATVKGLSGKKVYLLYIYGDTFTKIDSAIASDSGKFQMKMYEAMPAGMYRLALGKTPRAEFMGGDDSHLDVIFAHENIALTTTFEQPLDSIHIEESAENKLYFDFLHHDGQTKKKLDVLTGALKYYPKTDEFYVQFQKQFDKVLQQEQGDELAFLKKNAHTLAARILKFQLTPDYFLFLKATERQSEEERGQYMKEHFLDSLNFSDTLLLHSSFMTDKIVAFLSLFRNNQNSPEQQTKEFSKATDMLMNKVKPNDKIYEYVLTYIIRGFEKIGQEDVLIYISDKYLNSSCKNDELQESYHDKIEKMKKVAVGQPAPEIAIDDMQGDSIRLSDINTDYTLVLFWASWCPHCTAMLPELKKAYDAINTKSKTGKKMEVLAFSIDNDRAAWTKFVKDGGYNWINCSELKGWKSIIPATYNVYATPTMFLLDKKKQIIAKPNYPSEIESLVH